ncbi:MULTISPECIES: hypothetical protein [unclassified Novosphingobium]|uniref:hypothetical protein n=1 Tax=unclassified Novosphingobium TaxID=2644732 RepID=UPI001356D2E0|nr:MULTISPECIES: hypothetical protein [unclassified Novosphingobium]
MSMKIGDKVRWTSSNTCKRGVIEAIVPAGSLPGDVGFPNAGGGGMSRDHETYIVRGRKLNSAGAEYGSKGVYWPRVSLLELVPVTGRGEIEGEGDRG